MVAKRQQGTKAKRGAMERKRRLLKLSEKWAEERMLIVKRSRVKIKSEEGGAQRKIQEHPIQHYSKKSVPSALDAKKKDVLASKRQQEMEAKRAKNEQLLKYCKSSNAAPKTKKNSFSGKDNGGDEALDIDDGVFFSRSWFHGGDG